MLKKIRVSVALLCLLAVTLLFLDFTGTVHGYLGWCAKIQLVPAILAANFAIAFGIVLATLLLGRIYCSAMCPLGILQDIVSRLAGLKKKARFSYKKTRKGLFALHYSLLAAFIVALFSGGAIAAALDPYGAFGRIASQILGPVYKYANNLLAIFAERIDSYAFYSVDIWLKSSGALVVAILTFAIIVSFAYKSGRGYCNSICPVGAFLGLFAKYSFIKPRIDLSKCKHCNLCAKHCKASCIDSAAGKINYSHCVACFNCVEACASKAISYAPPSRIKSQETEALSNSGMERRSILSASALLMLGSAAKLQASQGDGGLTQLKNKEIPSRATPIVPPGAGSIWNFHKRCTACQLCSSVCPNQVLSNKAFGLMKPNMSYERGYCRPECVKCSEVCPSGAIKRITRVEKSAIQIGYAVWKAELCIASAGKVACGNCERHCPSGAITMIPKNSNDPASPKIPMVDTNRCIGCGACEHLCPVRPHSAIYVEGIEIHKTV
ncbi:MAG: 4Fe-4S dicluster domain-containing protein [Fibromonadaceae bacterium]|jgi:ferredoxin|nr:4Fe-4S dicluster domain-containing protein [Fibromonadaceae bacterium]